MAESGYLRQMEEREAGLQATTLVPGSASLTTTLGLDKINGHRGRQGGWNGSYLTTKHVQILNQMPKVI